jgi:hypothetical protein
MASWSIAISGGGHRAGLFGLGALMYIADAQLNRNVTSIASVSGGSVTNGFVAATVDYQSVDGDEFRKAMAPLVKKYAVEGTVQWARESVALCIGVAACIGLAVGAWWVPAPVWLRSLLCVLAAVVALIAIYARSWVADRVFRRLLFSSTTGPILLKDIKHAVIHVLCATEIQSAEHAYLSAKFCASYAYGVSTGAGWLPLSTAVQASACLPGAFPARSLSSDRLGFRHCASRMVLVDGGVYDNMGDQWAVGHAKRLERLPALAHLVGLPPENLIVVNASTRSAWSPSSIWARVPLVGEVVNLLRELDILYQVGTATRRSRMIGGFDAHRLAAGLPTDRDAMALKETIGLGGTLIHIGSSATWVRTSEKYGVDPHVCTSAVKALDEFPDQHWIDDAPRVAADVKTTLAKVGKEEAAALLWHGYVLTMINLHVFCGAPLVALPTKQQFQQLMT